jgi:heptosyltransferase I
VIPEAADALARARHLCIVLLTGLGDVVHGLPIVNAIRAARPDLRVTWVAEPMPAQLLSPHDAIHTVVAWNKKAGWRGVRELRARLATTRFDLTLNFNIYFKALLPTLLSRAPVRTGFGRGRARDGVWLAHTHNLPFGPRKHTQDMFLDFLDALNVPRPAPLEWRLHLTDTERDAQARFFAHFEGRPVCALVPASANLNKDWVPERHAPLVDALSELGFGVVLAGGPGARETAIATGIVERASRTPTWGLGEGVRRLLWLLAGCDLVIAPDTGPVHIARALDIPVIGLYGHTNPWRVGPYRKFEDLWVDAYDEPDEPPDPSNFEPRHGRMERITVDDVMARVYRAVGLYGIQLD